MPFNNPIVGGNTLVRKEIKSPNYVPGVSGWIIRKDGTVEFFGATIRGAIYTGTAPTGTGIAILSTGEIVVYNAGTVVGDWKNNGQLIVVGSSGAKIILDPTLAANPELVFQDSTGTNSLILAQDTTNPLLPKLVISNAAIIDAGNAILRALEADLTELTLGGVSAPRGYRAKFSDTANSAAIGTSETVIGTTSTMTFVNGRAYQVEIGGGLFGNTASNRGTFAIRKTNLAGAQLLNFTGSQTNATASQVEPVNLIGYVSNTTGSDITGTALALTLVANTGTVTHWGAATLPRYVVVRDAGAASDFTGVAVAIT